MLATLNVTFPFFALVLCGYLAARRGLLPLAAIPGMNSFVLFFALPCMLYRFGASTPIAQVLDPSVALSYLFCALVMVALVVSVTRRGRIGWNDAAFGALVGAFPNTGFMGVPLLVALLGPQAAGPAIVTILVDMVITTSHCIGLSRLGPAVADAAQPEMDVVQTSAAQAAKNALKGVAANPMPWAILSGARVSAYQLHLPAPVAATGGLLADSGHAPAVRWSEVLPVAGIKLFVHPLWVLAVGHTVRALGVPLDSFALTVMVLVAALPSASNVSMLAERFGADNGRIARIILVSTAVAFLSFSGAVAWMAAPR